MVGNAAYNAWTNETIISYLKTKPTETWHVNATGYKMIQSHHLKTKTTFPWVN